MLNKGRLNIKRWIKPLVMIISVAVIIIVGVIGKQRETGNLEDNISKHLTDQLRLKNLSENVFQLNTSDGIASGSHLGLSSFQGYSGPVEIAVKVSSEGQIQEIYVISQKETPSYFKKVMGARFNERLIGKNYKDPINLDKTIEAVSGATVTSLAITEATKKALYLISDEILGLSIPPAQAAKVIFGLPEISLTALYLLVLIGLTIGSKYKKVFRWISLISGLIILGFWLSIPLSLSKINSFLLGYWPDWHSNLYWYMLIFSVFGLIIINKKKYYCQWFCPFGAAQDILGLIGGASLKIPKWLRKGFLLTQRFLVWFAIVLAFFYRTPSKLNYEIFGTFFNLTGASILFAITIVFVIASLFMKRPWCNFLCPINGLEDFLINVRKLLKKQKIN